MTIRSRVAMVAAMVAMLNQGTNLGWSGTIKGNGMFGVTTQDRLRGKLRRAAWRKMRGR